MKISNRYTAIPDADSRARGDELTAWLRDHAERRVNSRLIDERRSIPPHIVLEWGRRGLFGMQVEERFGGLALRNREVARILEQAAAIDLGLATFLLTSLFPGVRPIAAFGSKTIKDRFLPDLASGRMLAGYAQSEPAAGTHFAAMEARAIQRFGGGWTVSGDKVWIGNASWAGVLSLVAYEFDAAGRRLDLLPLAISTDLAGVLPGAEIQSLGMRGMVQNEIAFRGVEVDPDCRLGEPAHGLDVGVDSMSFSRFAIAATGVGAMKRAVQLMARFASRRTIATGPLIDHPFALRGASEAIYKIEVTSALLYDIADLLDSGATVPVELFAVCKVISSEFAWETVDQLVQLLGSRGYDEANGIAQLLRDTRVTRIFEGATEPLLAFIGAQALNPRTEYWEFLTGRLSGTAIAKRLEEALEQLRVRSKGSTPLPRATRYELAGRAAVWALLQAALHRRGPTATVDLAATHDWTEAHFARLLARAASGREETPILTPAEIRNAVGCYVDSIGDVVQTLPGERRGLDRLLHRDDPAANA